MTKKLKLTLRILLVMAIIGGSLMVAHPTRAAGPYYWVAGSGNWTDATNHWSTSDGGAPGAGNLPTSADDVNFTANSNAGGGGASYTVTMNGNPGNCKDLNVANPSAGIVTIGGASAFTLNVYGSITRATGVLWTTSSSITLAATTAKTITSNGGSFAKGFTFNGIGGSWQLQDNLTITGAGLTGTNGTFDTNGKTVTLTQISMIGAGASVTTGASTITMTGDVLLNPGNITMGAATINCSTWVVSSGTVTAGTSTINVSGTGTNFAGNNQTYYNVVLNGITSTGTMTGANTFNNLTLTGTNVADASEYISGNQVVNGTFTATGYSQSHRLNVFSNTLHTARTLTVATMGTNSNVLFRDITAAGAANWDLSAQIGIGNASGNTGITFPTGINVYASQIPGNVNFTNTANWASASNGTPGSARVPLPQDMAVFDSHSMGVPGIIVTFDISNLSGMNTTAVTNNPQFNGTSQGFYNSVNLGTCIWNVTTDTYLWGNTAQTLHGDFSSGGGNLRIDVQSGSIAQSGDLTVGGTIYLQSGIWVTEGYAVTAKGFDSVTTTYNRALWMGNADSTLSSTFTLNGTAAGNKWNVAATNLNIDQIQSTIIFTNSTTNGQTFAGGGMTYNKLTIQGTGVYTTTLTGANTIDTITIDRTQAAKTLAGAVTATITHFYIPVSGTTVVTITNTDFNKSSGVVVSDYLSISGSAAGGGATYYAGSHSTNTSGNSGWIFTDPPTWPTATTLNASFVTFSSAVLNGALTNIGSFGSVIGYFQYDFDGSYVAPISTSQQVLTTNTSFTQAIASLYSNNTYHFRAVILSDLAHYSYGTDVTFTTSSVTPTPVPGSGGGTNPTTYPTTGVPVLPTPPGFFNPGTPTMPGADIPGDIESNSGLPVGLFFFIFGVILILAIGVFVHDKTKSLAAQFGIMALCILFASFFHFWPMWMIVPFALTGGACTLAGKVFSY